jgi:hypothetical protein
MGPREGFAPLIDKAVKVHIADPDLGLAVLSALDAAE